MTKVFKRDRSQGTLTEAEARPVPGMAEAPFSLSSFAPVTLQVAECRVERGGRTVLDGVSLTLSPGEVLLVTGPNGIGKSTLIRTIFGLVPPAAGAIRVDGPAVEEAGEVAPHCHYLGHRDSLKTAMTVAENLAFWRDFSGTPGLSVDESLAAVELDDLIDLPAAYLSAGQRRRLAIARLIAVRKPIWLLDEPTAALDTASEARFIDLMDAHRRAGGSILAATHLAIALPGTRRIALSPASAPDEVWA